MFKKITFLCVLAVLVCIGAALAEEEKAPAMMPGYGHHSEHMEHMEHGMMGQGQMGKGMMQLPCMTGQQATKPPCMTGQPMAVPPCMTGQGMGHGMMMGPGGMMMHRCMECMGQGMMGFSSPEKYQKFLDETKELRKELMNRKFEYHEAQRTEGSDSGKVKDIEKKMLELQKKIAEKAIDNR